MVSVQFGFYLHSHRIGKEGFPFKSRKYFLNLTQFITLVLENNVFEYFTFWLYEVEWIHFTYRFLRSAHSDVVVKSIKNL